jgi:hypothetical protein
VAERDAEDNPEEKDANMLKKNRPPMNYQQMRPLTSSKRPDEVFVVGGVHHGHHRRMTGVSGSLNRRSSGNQVSNAEAARGRVNGRTEPEEGDAHGNQAEAKPVDGTETLPDVFDEMLDVGGVVEAAGADEPPGGVPDFTEPAEAEPSTTDGDEDLNDVKPD